MKFHLDRIVDLNFDSTGKIVSASKFPHKAKFG